MSGSEKRYSKAPARTSRIPDVAGTLRLSSMFKLDTSEKQALRGALGGAQQVIRLGGLWALLILEIYFVDVSPWCSCRLLNALLTVFPPSLLPLDQVLYYQRYWVSFYPPHGLY